MTYAFTYRDESIPIVIRKHATSRRMVLRYRPRSHSIALTLPRSVSIRQGLSFVEAKRRWIEARLHETPENIPFAAGTALPFFGQALIIRHVAGRGVVRIEAGELLVPGEESFLARRVRDFIKEAVRKEVTVRAHEKAARIGKRVGKITVRDTGSHWGSCSHSGNLSFSWRLALAPYDVFDYVVAHEVAHLAHLNHSPAFWRAVESLCPRYRELRGWLKTHAAELHRYG